MIERWMLSVIVLGAVIAVGGTCLGHITSRAGMPRRWLWLVLMIASVALPVALALRSATPASSPAPNAPSRESSSAAITEQSAAPSAPPVNDTTLLLAWGLLSACLAGLFIATHRRTLAQLKSWESRDVLGSAVTISPDFGPAAVGFVHTRVVLPAWALELPTEEQSLVLRHEQQHIESGDHFVLLAGVLMVITMPWNLGLWWQLRRLRVGMELDCDARVAPSLRDRPRYAQLLLRSREQRQAHRLVLAMAPAPSALGERLLALLDRQRATWRQVTAWSLSAMACAGFLVNIPVPNVRPLFARTAPEAPVSTVAPLDALASTTHASAVDSRPAVRGPTRKPSTHVVSSAVPATGKTDTQKHAIDSVAVTPAVKRIRYDSLLPITPEMLVAPMARGGGRAGLVTTGAVTAKRIPPDTTSHNDR